MSPQSSSPLVVGVSAEALFAAAATERAPSAHDHPYDRPNRETDARPAGLALPLVEALLTSGPGTAPVVEMVCLSSQSAEAGLSVLASLRSRELAIERTVFTGGASCSRYLRAFEVDLFLTRDEGEAREAAEVGTPAVLVLPQPSEAPLEEVRVALDLDHAGADASGAPREREPDDSSLQQLATLALRLRGAAAAAGTPLRTALVTSRGAGDQADAIRRLGRSGLHVDEAFSLGGLPREAVLRSFGAQLLFDARHLASTADAKPEPVAGDSWVREDRSDAADSPGLDTAFSRLRGRRP
jgi:5'-nucleotidase